MQSTMPHQYPGVNLPLRHYPQPAETMYPIGAHQDCWGATSDILHIREVAMMILMNQITDKPNWHEKVFDEDIVSKWRKEAMEQPEDALYAQIVDGRIPDKIPKPRARIISETAFSYVSRQSSLRTAQRN